MQNGMRRVHPGEVLSQDYIAASGMTPEEFATRLGIPDAEVMAVLGGEIAMSESFATRLCAEFGGDVKSWLNLQAQFDAKNLSSQGFEALAQLMRLRPSKSREALRMVLCEGKSVKEAEALTGLAMQGIYRLHTSARRVMALAQTLSSNAS